MAIDFEDAKLELLFQELTSAVGEIPGVSRTEVEDELKKLLKESGQDFTEGIKLETFGEKLDWVVHHFDAWLEAVKGLDQEVVDDATRELRKLRAKNLLEKIELRGKEGKVYKFSKKK